MVRIPCGYLCPAQRSKGRLRARFAGIKQASYVELYEVVLLLSTIVGNLWIKI